MFERVREDIQSVFHRDPAARNTFEVVTCYPGLHAVWLHRVAHALWVAGWKWLARVVSNIGRWMTGDRNPSRGAKWSALLYRSRHGHCDWRDRGNR